MNLSPSRLLVGIFSQTRLNDRQRRELCIELQKLICRIVQSDGRPLDIEVKIKDALGESLYGDEPGEDRAKLLQ